MRNSLLFVHIGVLAACTRDGGLTKFNSAPEAQITDPEDGARVREGAVLALRGSASDPNHATDSLVARWFAAGAEVCGGVPPEADGTTSCTVTVPPGDAFEVRLEVVDPEGASGVARVTLAVDPDAAPTVEIVAPVPDGVYYSDQLVTLRGLIGDDVDAPDALGVRWVSSRDGEIVAPSTVTSSGQVEAFAQFSEGSHALQLLVADSAGNEVVDSVVIDVGPPNSAPVCAITAPTDGGASASGERVDLAALVSDVDVPATRLDVVWTSDKDGVLGASAPDSTGRVALATSGLSVDTHRITLTVTDEVGATCASGITWTVGTPPRITLEAPLPGEVVAEGAALAFAATVSDREDVAADLLVRWESDRDGVLHADAPDSAGVSQFAEAGLSAGEHVLTVTVTDTAGLYATALGTFVVDGVPSAPGVSLAPAGPQTDDDLTASVVTPSVDPEGDAVTYGYAWWRDGVRSAASSTATLPASATTRGEVWSVDVTASDGVSSSASGRASVTILNTEPLLGTVSVTPTSPRVGDVLGCTASASDADGDAPSLAYTWSTGATGPATVAAGAPGDTITCTVVATDDVGATVTASASVTLDNTPPTVSVTLAPTTVRTNDTLVASAVSADVDGDAVTVRYDWYVDGVLVRSGGDATLDGAADFDRDEVVYVVATADDGTGATSATSAPVTVANTAPTSPGVTVTPSPATAGDDLTCSVVAPSSDADGDPIVYGFDWDVDGTAFPGATDAASSSVVAGGDVGAEETWTCVVTASDGTDDASASASTETSCALGSEAACAGDSCLDILTAGGSVGSGTYWVDPYGTGAFRVYCDMTTDGGGWMLGFVKNSVDTDVYQDFGSAVEDVAHLAVSPTVASAASIAYGGWLDLNALSFTDLRLRAYTSGTQTYESNSIRKSDLRIRFGQNGYFLYNDRNGYYWCGGDYAYTDAGVGQVNRPSGAPSDCKEHGSLGSGWDFSSSDRVNEGLTLCGNDYSRWMHGTWAGSMVGYPSVGAAQAIFVR